MVRIAAAAYPIDWFDGWQQYEAKLSGWVDEAARAGAELLVFPEYGAMELASLAGKPRASDLQGSIDAVSDAMPEADALHSKLAARYGVHILGASAPVRLADGRTVNRASLFTPEGNVGIQDKLIMTRFERESWYVDPGAEARVFDTSLGRLGVAVCYDSEFPLIARSMVEAGVEILLVPSCTEKLAGYWRVRIGAMARALEGQCVAVHAPTVGDVDWSEAVDSNVGAAAVYGPPDRGFPATGVLSEGVLNQAGWVYAEADRDAIAEVRADGGVLNMRHWDEQDERLGRVKAVSLV
ncbi:carbon-nitrogen hydrolase family protein [Limibaculum sp. M0105]|uniref:Carbon-nitrogen hydrolase family protein n=1 Tax=Thermohalobaculum xanthum TaxID=2753746 RepID=A0A8J7M6Z5_9RHOB|nr:carbon-nitrogen hydrolase family protein [Thermohalobaculum xanthum]MBK0398865.1 carbon-nitrogen hydrolase family protein [Thermohalobaculum xanthum]